MTFVHRAAGEPKSLAIFAGAFNPPTNAHLALINAALDVVDEVLLAIPRTFPHKRYHGATLDQRLEMLQRIASSQPRVSAAVAEGGLFFEIAQEARSGYQDSEIHLLCGRDAAERIVTWDYGEPGFAEKILAEFSLLVAPRLGEYVPEERFAGRVRTLPTAGNFDECSSTRLRDVRQEGGDWRSLTPECIVDLVDAIYR
jgi:nicotinate (nicotinamide) nucleotide adenylyltransferase